MNKKIIALLASCCLFSTIFLTQKKEVEPEVDFYNTKFLRNSPVVEKILKADGFFEVDYKTNDGLMINAIMLDQSSTCAVTTTFVSCPGFVPGRKEGMSTLYDMLKDKPYNFIFIDSRGHGKSEGELLTLRGLQHYGEDQYLDMVATLQFIAAYNKKHDIAKNIIIHGLCAGAFHTIKAVNYLKKFDHETYDCIKGIIVDSGWPAITDIAETLTSAEATERCKTYCIPFLQPYLASFMMFIYNTFLRTQHSKQESLTLSMNNIDQPVFFIHAENDLFVPIHNVYPLITTAKNPTTWFVKESSHVNNHLKHKDAYKVQLGSFIQSTL